MFREVTVHTRKCVWTSYFTILVLKASNGVTLRYMNLRGNWLTNYSKYIIIYFISLACVSRQTHNLLRVFHPVGYSPFRYVRRQTVYGFLGVLVLDTGYQF